MHVQILPVTITDKNRVLYMSVLSWTHLTLSYNVETIFSTTKIKKESGAFLKSSSIFWANANM